MSARSYAQNFEDVLLRRALQDVPVGHYIDVGAGHPVHNSVTKLFYDAGWSGINIEPLPVLARSLAERRPRDVTVQAAVTTADVDTVDLTVVELWDELSTIRPERAGQLAAEGRLVSTTAVPAVRLDDVVAKHPVDEIHFLKVDVEGAELDVLETLDLTGTRPWIIVVEVVSGGGENNSRDAVRTHVESSSYRWAYFDGLNDFFVAAEHAEALLPRFAVPVNVTDDFVVESGSDHVVVDLVGERLGMAAPVQAGELLQRVDAVLRDRMDFENRSIELETGVAAVDTSALEAASARAAELENELRSASLSIEAFEQSAFERDRLIAWYAAEVAGLRSESAQQAARLAALHELAGGLQQRVTELLGSSSWRLSLPIRVVRRPTAYLRKLMRR